MKKLIECSKSKAMLRIAMFATLFVLMDILIEMNKKTEEQTTYSITLENLAHGQNGETNGENGGGTDGETGGGGGSIDGETGGGGTTGGTTTGGGGINGTPQAGKHKRDVTKKIIKYVKWEGGVKLFLGLPV